MSDDVAAVLANTTAWGACPEWCKDNRRGPHSHDYLRALTAAGYAVVPLAAVLVEAIWDRWDAALDDWDLAGSTANIQAKALAIEVVADNAAAIHDVCLRREDTT